MIVIPSGISYLGLALKLNLHGRHSNLSRVMAALRLRADRLRVNFTNKIVRAYSALPLMVCIIKNVLLPCESLFLSLLTTLRNVSIPCRGP